MTTAIALWAGAFGCLLAAAGIAGIPPQEAAVTPETWALVVAALALALIAAIVYAIWDADRPSDDDEIGRIEGMLTIGGGLPALAVRAPGQAMDLNGQTAAQAFPAPRPDEHLADPEQLERILAGLRAWERPDVQQRGEVPWPWTLALEPGLAHVVANPVPRTDGRYIPRHARVDDYIGPVTEEFARIVGDPASWWCDSCRVGRDGEPVHVSCAGCSCPCTTVQIGVPA